MESHYDNSQPLKKRSHVVLCPQSVTSGPPLLFSKTSLPFTCMFFFPPPAVPGLHHICKPYLSLSTCILTSSLMINENKPPWALWRVQRECVCVWGEESVCGSHTESVCAALCQCCVEDAVCSSGLGTMCIHLLFCVFVRVNITLTVVLCLKHSSDDSPSKKGSVCVSWWKCVFYTQLRK